MRKSKIFSLFAIFSLLSALPAFSSEASSSSEGASQIEKLDQSIEEKFAPISKAIQDVVFYSVPVSKNEEGETTAAMPLVLVWLAFASIFLTVYFKFVNFRSWKLAFNTVKGKYSSPSDPGEITHFQALTAALSGTVGLGNIAGVAVAVSIGGPGATFWMILMGLFGMASKFCECTLGVKYRTIENGKVYGGPMQYLKKGFAEKGMGQLGLILAGVFAFLCIGGSFGGGNMYQANQACSQLIEVTGGEGSFFDKFRWLFGLLMGVAVGLVIIGGIKSIASVTAALVPFMCGIYMLAGFVVILTNLGALGDALGTIFSSAFDTAAVGGGLVGVLIQGIKRAAFSNEAGIGSAPIAHSAVKTRFPASEGIVALLEPFVDTVVVCTMTALVIVIAGTYDDPGLEGVAITSAAFEGAISWFPLILAIAVILFAFSTMISWSYYGMQAWAFLFGKSKGAELAYKLLFCFFVVVGASMSLGSVIGFSDAMIFAMSVPNVIAMYVLMPKVKEEYEQFLTHSKK